MGKSTGFEPKSPHSSMISKAHIYADIGIILGDFRPLLFPKNILDVPNP